MRKIHSKEDIERRLASLPADIRSFLYSLDFDVLIQQISVKNRLHIDQMTTLAAETNEVITGFTEPKDFVQNLTQTLQIDSNTAEAIAKDVNEQIFLKIRDSMKKVHEPQKQPVPAAQPDLTPATPAHSPASVPPTAAPAPAPAAVKPPAPPVSSSAPAADAPSAPAAPEKPPAPTPAPAQPPAIAVPKTPTLLNADLALSQKTVAAPKPSATPPPPPPPASQPPQANKPPAPPKPGGYTADPYREPVE